MASRWVHLGEDERQQARSSFCEVSTWWRTSSSKATVEPSNGRWWKWFLGTADPGSHVFILPVWCWWRGEECVWRFGPAVCTCNNSQIVWPFPASLQYFFSPALLKMSDLCHTLVVLSINSLRWAPEMASWKETGFTSRAAFNEIWNFNQSHHWRKWEESMALNLYIQEVSFRSLL